MESKQISRKCPPIDLLQIAMGASLGRLLTSYVAPAAVVLAVLAYVLLKAVESTMRVKPSAVIASLSRKPGRLYPPKSGMVVDRAACVGRDSLFDVAAAREWMAFCEFKDGQKSVSCIYSFPLLSRVLFAEVISSDGFPLSIMGVIHARQVVEQYAPMNEKLGAYDHKVRCCLLGLIFLVISSPHPLLSWH